MFLAPAEAVFGTAGRIVVGVMLAAALLLGAQAYVSVLCDAMVIGALLLIFGSDVINIVAAANIGYLAVFVLMPLAFVLIRRQRRRLGEPLMALRRWRDAARRGRAVEAEEAEGAGVGI